MFIPTETTPSMQRILALLDRKSGMSASDISQEAFVGLTTLSSGAYLRVLKKKGIIFISGWRKTHKGFVTPLYSLGSGSDVDRPRFSEKDRITEGMDRIMKAFATRRRMTSIEVADASGIAYNTINTGRYLDILAKKNMIHVASWRRNKAGSMAAVYELGPGDAAEKPAPLTQAEKNRRYRDKKRVLTADRSLRAQLSMCA